MASTTSLSCASILWNDPAVQAAALFPWSVEVSNAPHHGAQQVTGAPSLPLPHLPRYTSITTSTSFVWFERTRVPGFKNSNLATRRAGRNRPLSHTIQTWQAVSAPSLFAASRPPAALLPTQNEVSSTCDPRSLPPLPLLRGVCHDVPAHRLQPRLTPLSVFSPTYPPLFHLSSLFLSKLAPLAAWARWTSSTSSVVRFKNSPTQSHPCLFAAFCALPRPSPLLFSI